MNAAERTVLIDKLRASRDAVVQAAANLSDQQAKFQTAPDRWSIESIIEHLAITEYGTYRLNTAYSEPLDARDDGGRERALEESAGNRQITMIPAPERARPTGRYHSLSEALKQFLANRERNIEYVASCTDDLRMRAINHPLRRMTCHESIGVLIGHSLRHTEQIKEIKTSTHYPARFGTGVSK